MPIEVDKRFCNLSLLINFLQHAFALANTKQHWINKTNFLLADIQTKIRIDKPNSLSEKFFTFASNNFREFNLIWLLGMESDSPRVQDTEFRRLFYFDGERSSDEDTCCIAADAKTIAEIPSILYRVDLDHTEVFGIYGDRDALRTRLYSLSHKVVNRSRIVSLLITSCQVFGKFLMNRRLLSHLFPWIIEWFVKLITLGLLPLWCNDIYKIFVQPLSSAHPNTSLLTSAINMNCTVDLILRQIIGREKQVIETFNPFRTASEFTRQIVSLID